MVIRLPKPHRPMHELCVVMYAMSFIWRAVSDKSIRESKFMSRIGQNYSRKNSCRESDKTIRELEFMSRISNRSIRESEFMSRIGQNYSRKKFMSRIGQNYSRIRIHVENIEQKYSRIRIHVENRTKLFENKTPAEAFTLA